MTEIVGGAKPSFTCPCCGAVSYNPNDIAQRFCGRCHDWTGDPALAARHLARDCPHRKLNPAFADLGWLLDAGLEVRIAPDAAGMRVTLFEGAGSVPVVDPVTAWPNTAAGAALTGARILAEQAGYAPGGIKP